LQEHPSASRLRAITDDSKLDEVVATVKRWLDHPKNARWLMAFDNYDDPKVPGKVDHAAVDIRQFLPEAYHGSILVTTRSSKINMVVAYELASWKTYATASEFCLMLHTVKVLWMVRNFLLLHMQR
jgi:hypothetical protein